MSGALLSLLCLGLGAAIWLVAYRPRMDADARRRLVAAGLLAAPTLVLGCLAIAWAGGRFGEFRLTLTQVEAEVRQYPMTLGGDPERDDVVTPRMAASVAAIAPAPGADAARAPLVLQIAGSDAEPATAVVGLRRGGETTFPTSRPFAEGDAVCVAAPCEKDGASWAVLRGRTLAGAVWRDGGIVLDAGGEPGRPMPQRKTLLAFGGVNDWTPAQAIHPLRDYFPHPMGAPADGVMRDCDHWLCTGRGAGRAPARSFLFQEGGLGGSGWRIVLADSGARIARQDAAGRLAVLPFAAPTPIPLGEGLGIDLWDVRYIDAPLDEPDARRGQLQLRRSLVAAERDGRAHVTFDTPPVQVVPGCERGAGGLPASGAAVTALGGRTAEAVGGALPQPDEDACGRFNRAAFELPADRSDLLRAAGFRLERLAAPWPMAWIAVLWAAAVLAACRELLARRPAVWAILAVLQFLLALRFLFGLSGAAADPALDWRAILRDAAAAYVVVPAGVLAWARWGSPRRPAEWLLDLAPPAAVICAALWTGGVGIVSVLLLAVWLAAVLHRCASAPAPAPGRRATAGDRAGAALARLERRLVPRFGALSAPRASELAPMAGVGLLVIVLAARLVAGAFGWKERIDLGVMVLAISVIYTPLLIVGFSRMLASGQAAARSWLRPVLFHLLLAAAVLALPMSVRDSGYALMFAPMAGMAAWCAWTNRRALGASAGTAALWAAPALAALALLVALPTAGAVSSARAERLALTPQMHQGLSDAEALDVLARQADASQNLLRLYLLGAPEALGAAGSAEAEGLKVWSAQLADYAGSLWGRGYLTSPNLTALRSVQNSDNLTAIQLMSPFGRLATGMLLGLLAAAPIALAAMTRGQGPSGWRRICGFMALWCVFGAAAYMTLANLQLVPFTGRNAYLLASTSGGDLLEGAALFCLAAWGIGGRGRTEARA